jgi:signal transduction histidine kinase
MKIETGVKLGYKLANNPPEMLEFSNQLFNICREMNAGYMLSARVARLVADAYYYTDSIEQSTSYLQKALELAGNATPVDTGFLGNMYNDIGLNYQLMGKRYEAFNNFEKSISLLDGTTLLTELSDAKSNMAGWYYAKGNCREAINLYVEVYEIDKQTKNKRGQASSLNNIGRMYVDWGKYETALDYYTQSAALLDSLGEMRLLGIRFNNIGMVHQTLGNHTEAINWFEKARAIEEPFGQTPILATRLCNLGTSYGAFGQYSKAEANLKKGLEIFKKAGLNSKASKTYSLLARIYKNMKKPDLARECLNNAITYAQKSNTLPELSIAYHQMWMLNKEQGNFKDALRYHELYTQIEDSVYSIDVNKKIEELDAQYQSQQKEAEITRLETENQLNLAQITFKNRQRNMALIAAFVLLLILALVYRLFATVKRQKVTLASQNDELERLNHSLNRLFAIISHDLRNATASYQSSAKIIGHYLQKGQPEKLMPLSDEISTNARNLSNMLENLLLWAASQLNGVSVNKEVVKLKGQVKAVLEILTSEFERKGNQLELDIDESMQVFCDPESLNLIVRNLVGNACKFTKEGIIAVKAQKSGEKVKLTVSDNGTGIPHQKLEHLFNFNADKPGRGTSGEKGTGLGLVLVAEHVKRNGGSIDVQSVVEKGTVFTVELPVGQN